MSDSRDCKQIKLDAEVEPQTGDDSVDNNDVQSDFSELTTLERQPKYSCWDQIDPEALDLEDFAGDRIYVHREILEWIVEFIDKNILSEKYRATVEEVHHHNLDGSVFLIKFYKSKTTSKIYDPYKPKFRKILTDIKEQLQYKMPWQSKPKYFLRIHSPWYQSNKKLIMDYLQQLNLAECLTSTILDVNWMYMEKIEVFEFPESLAQEQLYRIDSIFKKWKFLTPIYICEQFVWHKEMNNFYNVDTLAMDVCAEEWRRCDLLKDFRLTDILNIDLANKDYRDPYFNEYLDRYLDILLKRSLPMLFSENDEKLEVYVHHLDLHIQHYFVARFYQKLALVCEEGRVRHHPLVHHGIHLVRKRRAQFILRDNTPIPYELLREDLQKKFHLINFEISNYAHFSDSLFRMLLDKRNELQQYFISFEIGFIFSYDENKPYSNDLVKDSNWMIGHKKIRIELGLCTENNAVCMANFVQYLFKLFTQREQLEIEVTLCFDRCVLEDYSFLESIGCCIQKVRFKMMNLSSHQLNVLSRALGQHRRSVEFVNCKGITDNNVMILLENIAFDDLHINGINSCTPLVFLLISEYLMNKEGVDTIKGNRFFHNMKDCCTGWNLEPIDFKKTVHDNGDQMIIVRNRHSEETLDLYCFINRVHVR